MFGGFYVMGVASLIGFFSISFSLFFFGESDSLFVVSGINNGDIDVRF